MRVLRAESAEADLDAIAEYFGALNPTATLAMLDRITAVEATLADYPLIGRSGRVPGTRESVVTGTPFVLVYSIGDNAVTVLRVLHARRQWPDR